MIIFTFGYVYIYMQLVKNLKVLSTQFLLRYFKHMIITLVRNTVSIFSSVRQL